MLAQPPEAKPTQVYVARGLVGFPSRFHTSWSTRCWWCDLGMGSTLRETKSGASRRAGACRKMDKGVRGAMGHVGKWTRASRRNGACRKVDKGLRVAMGHVGKWTRGSASRWGMSENGHGPARRNGACRKMDKGVRGAMGHVGKWTRVFAAQWGMSENGHGPARRNGHLETTQDRLSLPSSRGHPLPLAAGPFYAKRGLFLVRDEFGIAHPLHERTEHARQTGFDLG